MSQLKRTCTIYYTSDIHGFLFPTDYLSTDTLPMGLLACLPLIKKDGDTLILDGGDTIQGSPFLHVLRHDPQGRFPIIDVMNRIGYDCVTLGNHDFNYGYGGLKEFLGSLQATCVCANVIDTAKELPLASYAVKTLENGLKVGIVGIVTDYVPVWEPKENLQHLIIEDAFASASRMVDLLKGKVDILVGLYHGGYECDLASGAVLSKTNEDIACRLCRGLGFDILLTGHQHAHHDGQYVSGTYTLQPLSAAREVCRLTIEVDADGNLQITDDWLRPNPNATLELHDLHWLEDVEEKVQHELDAPVAHLAEAIVFDTRPKMAMNGNKVAEFTNLVQMKAGHADVSCTCLYGVGVNWYQNITVRDVLSTYPFPNTLKVLKVTGRALRLSLERCASFFVINAQKQPDFSTGFSQHERDAYDYDYFLGIEYRFDISKPIGQRVVQFEYQGQPVGDGQTLCVAMNSYRASGGGGYPWYQECAIIMDSQLEIPQLMMEYLELYGFPPFMPSQSLLVPITG